MTSNRPRLTRRTASRWLDHPREQSGDPMGAVLSAAAAESRGTAAAGEEVAVAQFRAAALASTAPVRAPRKLFTAPVVAAGAVGALLVGGVAVAATSGTIDVPFDGHDNRSDHAPDAPSSTNPGHDRTDKPKPNKPKPNKPGKPEPTSGPGSSSAAPAPSLKGLCNAYQQGAFKEGTKSQAFQALVKAAGGVDQVSTFCIDLIGPPKTRAPKPTQAATPTKPPQAGQPAEPTKPPQAGQPGGSTKAPKPSKTPKGKPVKAPAHAQTSTS